MIWNSATREDLRREIEFQLKSLEKANQKFKDRVHVWNHKEFKVEYKSLENEVKIRDYYLKYLTKEENHVIYTIIWIIIFYRLKMHIN